MEKCVFLLSDHGSTNVIALSMLL